MDHVSEAGEQLFQLACEHDLEGIIAKPKNSPYLAVNGESPWIKIRNPQYSQIIGRDELFEKSEPAVDARDWEGCVEACIAAG